jgi:hypothetical protein
VGRRITGLFFYQNRLGFLAGESCILSEASEFFNFWPTTVTTMVDSDPIDVAASHTKATTLHHAAAFSEGLLLFSDQTQFLLEHGDILSGKTTAVKPITEFECSVKAAPLPAGKDVFFATSRGNFSGVREYYIKDGDASLADAYDVSSHVPHYIRGDIHRFMGSVNEDCLLCVTSEARNGLVLYKYFTNGEERLQSSWSKWFFSGEVLSGDFINSRLFLVMQYADGVYLEVLHIEPGYTDQDSPFEFALDRKVSEAEMTALSYNARARLTTLNFPYQLTAEPAVVSRYGPEAASPGVIYEVVSWSGHTAQVKGDLRGTPFFAGIPYLSLFEFSPQIMRESSGSGGGKLAVTEGRLQLRGFTLTYGSTGYFEVLVTPEYRETDRRVFNGRIRDSMAASFPSPLKDGPSTLEGHALSSVHIILTLNSSSSKFTVTSLRSSLLWFVMIHSKNLLSAGTTPFFRVTSPTFGLPGIFISPYCLLRPSRYLITSYSTLRPLTSLKP